MERTIGRKWGSTLRGAGLCDDCGVRFPIEELQRNADGFLMCRSCGEGRCRSELDQARMAAASDVDMRELQAEQARFDRGDT